MKEFCCQCAQKTAKGLTSIIINHVLKLFTYYVSPNQGEPEKTKPELNSLVCDAFGDHCKCDVDSCRALNNKSNDLPEAKPLSDENLWAAIESAVKPFQTNKWCEKLADRNKGSQNKTLKEVQGV